MQDDRSIPSADIIWTEVARSPTSPYKGVTPEAGVDPDEGCKGESTDEETRLDRGDVM